MRGRSFAPSFGLGKVVPFASLGTVRVDVAKFLPSHFGIVWVVVRVLQMLAFCVTPMLVDITATVASRPTSIWKEVSNGAYFAVNCTY